MFCIYCSSNTRETKRMEHRAERIAHSMIYALRRSHFPPIAYSAL